MLIRYCGSRSRVGCGDIPSISVGNDAEEDGADTASHLQFLQSCSILLVFSTFALTNEHVMPQVMSAVGRLN